MPRVSPPASRPTARGGRQRKATRVNAPEVGPFGGRRMSSMLHRWCRWPGLLRAVGGAAGGAARRPAESAAAGAGGTDAGPSLTTSSGGAVGSGGAAAMTSGDEASALEDGSAVGQLVVSSSPAFLL